MKVSELIEKLQSLNHPNLEVTLYDTEWNNYYNATNVEVESVNREGAVYVTCYTGVPDTRVLVIG